MINYQGRRRDVVQMSNHRLDQFDDGEPDPLTVLECEEECEVEDVTDEDLLLYSFTFREDELHWDAVAERMERRSRRREKRL